MKLRATLTIFFAAFFITVYGQDFIMDGTPINACSGFFMDSGGSNSYGPNESLTTTICADGVGGTHIQLIFSGTDLGAGDDICFYDGTDTGAPLLTCASAFNGQGEFIIQATAPNLTGCVTVVFTSDAVGEGEGFSADINCIAACQTIQSILVSSDPEVSPVDTGYIDICPGERVFFTGAGSYPQNGQVYNHSDFTSTFEWDFGDGVIGYGPNVTHVYDNPGGYVVQLTIIDTLQCQNTNFISQRVRVSTKPTFDLGGDLASQICANDTVMLSAMVNQLDSNAIVSVSPNTGTFSVAGIRSDSLPLPDGDGTSYQTSINFSDFAPGAVLTDINDLESICVNMEHSWMRDLEITLTCPDGTTIVLHDHPGQTGGQVFLGEPIDNDGGFPTPGLGYDYCWTPNATNPTWIQYSNANFPGTLPPGDYSTVDPMTDLLGCPLNGEWTITVTDLWASDNGFMFNWSINFNEDLYPNVEVFTPNLIDWAWNNNPSIYFQTMDSIAAAPQNAGTASYTFTVDDDFGCTWDTMVNFQVLPFTHPDCYSCQDILSPAPDTTVCVGESVDLNVFSEVPTEFDVTFESYPAYDFNPTNHPPANPYAAGIDVVAINPGFVTNPLVDIVSVCVDITTDFASDVAIYLQSPNGDLLELSSNNGGGQDNYTQTCFTPTATTPIQMGTPPFTGEFSPEGNWNALNGSPINGEWNLLVSDGFAPNVFSTLNWWTITFNSVNNVAYDWTNGASLTCDNCPDPTANPMATTTYTVTAVDSYQCSSMDEVEITVLENFSAPAINCNAIGNGEIVVTWNEVGGGLEYEINIDGTGWVAPNEGLTQHLLTGYVNGEMANVQVRVKTTGGGACAVNIGEEVCLYLLCDLVATIPNGTDTVSCPGDCDGIVPVSAMNGVSPFDYNATYLDDGSMWTQNNGNFTGLCAGDYQIIVEDAVGCMDTVFFTVFEPDPIIVSIIETESLDCFGDSDGELVASGVGGVGDYDFAWNDMSGQINPTAVGLNADNYTVVLTDDNGCTGSGNFDLMQPTEIMLATASTDVLCKGAMTGTATVNPMGGTGTYTYAWSDGDSPTAQNNDGLGEGLVSVTVSDVNGCTAMEDVLINEPAEGLELMIAQTAESCFQANSGQALVTPMGGSNGYTYEWSSGATTPEASDLAPQNYTVTVTDGNDCTATESIDITELAVVEIENINFLPPSCSGFSDGAISIVDTPDNITGGAGGPYTYLWNDGTTNSLNENLIGGQAYSVTVTDVAGCTVIGVQFLDDPLPLTFDVAGQDVLCFQDATGTATVSNVQLNPGDMVDAYSWSLNAGGQTTESVTNLSAGEYIVTITDSEGCTAENSVTINEPTDIDVDFSVVDAACFGQLSGEITALPTGGVPGYNFQWDGGIGVNSAKVTDIPPNNYNVTITDNNGCEHIDSVLVNQPAEITADVNPTDVTCFGDRDGMVQLTTDGGTAPFRYSLDGENFFGSSTLIGLESGDYNIVISDANGCTTEKFANVGTPPLFTVDILDTSGTLNSDNTIQFGESINAEGLPQNGQGMIDYFWSASYCGTMMCPTADTTDCSGEVTCSNPILTPNNPITYSVTAIDEAGCEATANLVVFVEKTRRVLVPTGFAPDGNALNQALHVHGKSGTTINIFRIFDRWGELIYESSNFDINDTTVGWNGTFNGEEMPSGVYVWFLEAQFEDGATEIFKGETTLIR
jgi:gliding motility-associated-like protein